MLSYVFKHQPVKNYLIPEDHRITILVFRRVAEQDDPCILTAIGHQLCIVIYYSIGTLLRLSTQICFHRHRLATCLDTDTSISFAFSFPDEHHENYHFGCVFGVIHFWFGIATAKRQTASADEHRVGVFENGLACRCNKSNRGVTRKLRESH